MRPFTPSPDRPWIPTSVDVADTRSRTDGPGRVTVRKGRPLNDADRTLIREARIALRRGYDPHRHTVAAAVRTRSGSTYVGLNLEGVHTPCAEPIAIGRALTDGDRAVESMVAVCRRKRAYPVLSPCGACRQLLFDYAPTARVIVRFPDGRTASLTAEEALPGAFEFFADP